MSTIQIYSQLLHNKLTIILHRFKVIQICWFHQGILRKNPQKNQDFTFLAQKFLQNVKIYPRKKFRKINLFYFKINNLDLVFLLYAVLQYRTDEVNLWSIYV